MKDAVIRTYLRRIYCRGTTHFLVVVAAFFLLAASERKSRINQRFVKVCTLCALLSSSLIAFHLVEWLKYANLTTLLRVNILLFAPIIDENFGEHTQQNWRYIKSLIIQLLGRCASFKWFFDAFHRNSFVQFFYIWMLKSAYLWHIHQFFLTAAAWVRVVDDKGNGHFNRQRGIMDWRKTQVQKQTRNFNQCQLFN